MCSVIFNNTVIMKQNTLAETGLDTDLGHQLDP